MYKASWYINTLMIGNHGNTVYISNSIIIQVNLAISTTELSPLLLKPPTTISLS